MYILVHLFTILVVIDFVNNYFKYLIDSVRIRKISV